MIKKSFEEMMKVKIDKYTKKRDGAEYLPWAACMVLLYKNGAEKVFFEPLVDPITNSSVFMSDKEFKDKTGTINRCYEVAVRITIDDDVFVMRTPIMNGANPVKDNSLSQQRVWAAQCRAFVKGVAMRTGLGFNLWLRGDLEDQDEDDTWMQDVRKYCEKLQELYSTALSKFKKNALVYKALDMTEEEVLNHFKYCDQLYNMEEKLIAAINS